MHETHTHTKQPQVANPRKESARKERETKPDRKPSPISSRFPRQPPETTKHLPICVAQQIRVLQYARKQKKDALDTLPIPKYAPWFPPKHHFLCENKKPFFISSHADITTIAMIRRRPPLKFSTPTQHPMIKTRHPRLRIPRPAPTRCNAEMMLQRS